jgi:hypothetical protein
MDNGPVIKRTTDPVRKNLYLIRMKAMMPEINIKPLQMIGVTGALIAKRLKINTKERIVDIILK